MIERKELLTVQMGLQLYLNVIVPVAFSGVTMDAKVT
jgi:hypothetical protein